MSSGAPSLAVGPETVGRAVAAVPGGRGEVEVEACAVVVASATEGAELSRRGASGKEVQVVGCGKGMKIEPDLETTLRSSSRLTKRSWTSSRVCGSTGAGSHQG